MSIDMGKVCTADYEKHVLQAMMCMTRQCWEDGIAATALMEIGEEELLSLVVYDMVLRQSSDGRLCNVENTPAVTDSSFCVPAVWAAGQKNGEDSEKYRQAALRNIDFFLQGAERTADGTLFHMIHTAQVWADSAAFLPYVLALTGHYEESWVQMKGITDRLYDEKSGLYFHMWDDEKGEFIRPLPWGVGNGWILTGLLRCIDVWNGADDIRDRMKDMFRNLLDNMLKHETDQHLFRDIMDDPQSFEEMESSAMVAYAIYRGVGSGLVDQQLLKEADAIREAIHARTLENGLVIGAASSPDFVRPGTSVECQAHVLMMEQACRNVRIS